VFWQIIDATERGAEVFSLFYLQPFLYYIYRNCFIAFDVINNPTNKAIIGHVSFLLFNEISRFPSKHFNPDKINFSTWSAVHGIDLT
jgi:hypothetical protein